MYMSLDRIDIELAPRDGRARLVQTDHRTPDEMAERPAMSTIIVLIRSLNPRRMYHDLDLFYNFVADPPTYICDALAAAGAHLWVGTEPSFIDRTFPAAQPAHCLVDELANASIAQLAGELTSRRFNAEPLPSLERLEHQTARRGFPDEKDTVAFWTTILELGALAAQAIHSTNGGSWSYNEKAPGSFPLSYRCSFRGEQATVNPLGKALKFVRNRGGGDEPSLLVKMLASAP